MRVAQRPGLVAVASHLWSSPVHAAATDLLNPRAGEWVIDLGAGLGAGTLHLAKRLAPGGHVVAVDPSRLMRTVLRARRAVNRNRNLIEVKDGTAEALPLAGRRVDAVIALNVAHLLRDLDATATELVRVLRPDGRILFVEEDIDDPTHRFHHTEPHAPGGPTVNDLTGALDGVGLTATVDRLRLGGQPVTTIEGRTPS